MWSIADQLRGSYRPSQCGNVIPLTILRRLDCILEPDPETVRELAAKYDNPNKVGSSDRLSGSVMGRRFFQSRQPGGV